MGERSDIVKLVIGFCALYDKEVSKPLILIYEKALGDLTEEELEIAVKKFMRGPNSKFFPKPGQIYQLAKPEIEAEDEAGMIADVIMIEVSCHGGPDEYNAKRAQLKIGPIGWDYIKKYGGGWTKFSQSFDENTNIEVVKSQIRRAIKGLIISHRAGMESQLQVKQVEEQRSLMDFNLRLNDLNGTDNSDKK